MEALQLNNTRLVQNNHPMITGRMLELLMEGQSVMFSYSNYVLLLLQFHILHK